MDMDMDMDIQSQINIVERSIGEEELLMFYRIFIKRLLDLFFAFCLLLILFIPMILIGIIIRLTSKGPALFTQKRYGRYSRPFTLYKFRSMTIQAPQRANSDFDDIRNYVTPFGMFIRKTSIDELPQLWNIIKGDMSFIGPRPLASTDKLVLNLRKANGSDSVLPGISGLAQVNGRNRITDDEKAFYDGEYASNVSFRLDLFLAVETLFAVLRRDGVFNDSIIKKRKKNDP